jgi:hypothetical protein
MQSARDGGLSPTSCERSSCVIDAVEAIALEQLVATHQERELAWSS